MQVAKQFIDGELAKYESREECKKQGAMLSGLLQSMADSAADKFHPVQWFFNKGKTEGSGRAIICAFLGENWKEWMVEDAPC